MRPARNRDGADMDVPAHEVQLKLWLDGDSVTGRASSPGEAARDFAGWLGLVAAIEALIAPRHRHGADEGGDPTADREDHGDGTIA